MDRQLHELIKSLKSEKCPPAVAQAAKAEIEASTPRRTSVWTWGGLSIAGSLAIILLGLFLIPANQPTPAPENITFIQAEPSETKASPEKTAEVAVLSLTYLGTMLMESGKHVEARLVKASNESLQDPYQDVKYFIINQINQ